ncbi:MAG: PD-(D/E)XK nuclease family protein [Chloroflexi bacterium]|nr:PD-(D/E)XK nuclease family protein [Chloroflexota bacterium]
MVPEGFVFSQSSLQDYMDCPRRFQLRYLEQCLWPAPETADALDFERFMQRGQAFHRLLRQLYSGVPREALEAVAMADPDLARWWLNYRHASPQDLPTAVQEAEVALSVAIALPEQGERAEGGDGRFRLEARYDLLAGEPGGRWVIVDWKTGQHRNSRAWLQQRLQTRIYPYVLVQAGAMFNQGEPIAPQQVEMLYWFAEFPAQPERFSYSEEQFAADAAFLADLVYEIARRPEEVFPKTEQRRLCRYCVYRSLCWTDVEAGLLAEAGEVEAVEAALEDLDLESIAPIPF